MHEEESHSENSSFKLSKVKLDEEEFENSDLDDLNNSENEDLID